MDCLEVQELLSEAVDGEPVDRDKLAEAREHCGTCPSCMVFVRGLALTHRSEPPQEPEGLADRVVTALREEAAREEVAHAESAARQSEVVVADSLSERAASETPALPETAAPPSPLTGAAARGASQTRRPRRRMSPVAIGAWIGAAAALLIIAGFAAVSGVRSIVGGSSQATLSDSRTENGAVTTAPLTDQSAESASKSATSSAGAGAAATALEVPAPNMISVGGFAYRLIGRAGVDQSKLTTYTTTTTSFGSSEAAQLSTVYKTPTAGRVALISADELVLFDLVKRSYETRPYALTSGPLTSFSQWPSLPSSIPVPTTPEGAPTFVSAGLDDTGLEVYRQPNVAVSQGIAVPPNTPQSDPAGGNPNWTWWSPPPQ